MHVCPGGTAEVLTRQVVAKQQEAGSAAAMHEYHE